MSFLSCWQQKEFSHCSFQKGIFHIGSVTSSESPYQGDKRSLTVMQMVKPGEVEGVLGVLRMLGVMEATGHVNADTL